MNIVALCCLWFAIGDEMSDLRNSNLTNVITLIKSELESLSFWTRLEYTIFD